MNENAQSVIDWFTGAPLRILLILIVALVLQKTASRAITRAINRIAEADLIPGPNRSLERQRERARTAGSVLRSTSNATIWLITSTMVLGQLGLDLGPLVASAGVIGVALGLGAQTIVRDVLSGIFMLVEDQYGVGDEINVLDVEGVVENVGLRITTVRDKKGTLWYLRNGEILKVGNKSKKKR
ncbi:MAG: small-conductance mechanosensitive channel [Actinobacteria bacterium]|jgi:moderate conductance mechanosensitive channel|nr:mechanosensitive ion channel [Actinomycetota bacterium]NBY32308.1 small-conductance mechanosensitive channel [Actinomycetota bacterium]NDH13196.1 small-conductance mechanosensitive channel [Actinomycetota bacterium]